MIEKYPAKNELVEWAWAAMHKGEWTSACQRWSLFRELYPEEINGWVHGALALRKLGEYDEAERYLIYALDSFPMQSSPLRVLARLSIEKECYTKAVKFSQEATKKFPEETKCHLILVESFVAANEYTKARELVDYCCLKFPNSAEFFSLSAELYEKEGRWDEAVNAWERMLLKFPEMSDGYCKAAKAAYEAGEKNKSRLFKSAAKFGMDWYVEALESQKKQDQVSITPPLNMSFPRFIHLTWVKARMNLKSEASRNHLKYAWWLLDPILYMVVFYLVFGVLMNRGGEGYIAYLLTGLVPFQWFAKSVQQTSTSIVSAKGLMQQIKIPPIFFPLVGVVQNFGKQVVVFLVLFVFLYFYGVDLTLSWLYLPLVVMINLYFIVVVSCSISLAIPFVRDLNNLVPTGIQFLMFTSGIFYSISDIPERWHSVFLMNPMANILHQYRLVILEGGKPDLLWLCYVLGFCVLVNILMAIFYKSTKSVYPRLVAE